jgi:hypothetical protein
VDVIEQVLFPWGPGRTTLDPGSPRASVHLHGGPMFQRLHAGLLVDAEHGGACGRKSGSGLCSQAGRDAVGGSLPAARARSPCG